MIWKIQTPSAPSLPIQDICSHFKCSIHLAKILQNKNFSCLKEIQNFLHPALDQLSSPFLMKDMQKSVDRIKKAIFNKKKILIYGDYDADGITSVALLMLSLSCVTPHISYFIPNRLEEGYGLNEDAIHIAKENNVDLMITVDCGITSFKEAMLCKELGIDLIITDHHEPQEQLPDVYSIINPKQKDCPYPFKLLAGVGVAYNLLCALQLADSLLDLVALGTIADVVPLIGENRTLAKFGLKELMRSSKPGIKSLLRVAKLTDKEIKAQDVSFMLAPRINAIGRLGDPKESVQMLITQDEEKAYAIAAYLDHENKQRQDIEQKIFKKAIEKIETFFDFDKEFVIILEDDSWHIGVIGIVAARIVERYYRPAIVISSHEDQWCKGSCRSIKGFNIFNALSYCAKYLDQFGGHEYAAGLSLLKNQIPEFKSKIHEYVSLHVDTSLLSPQIDIDAEIRLEDISMDLYEELILLAPFGTKNPVPVFTTTQVFLKTMPRIAGADHLQFFITNKNNISIPCVAFKMRHRYEDLCSAFLEKKPIDIAFSILLNQWQGNQNLQLNIKDVKISHP